MDPETPTPPESADDRKRRLSRERRKRWVATHTKEDPEFADRWHARCTVYNREWNAKRRAEYKELKKVVATLNLQPAGQ